MFNRLVGLALAIAGIALAAMSAYTIQFVTFGGYVFEFGMFVGGLAFAVGTYLVTARNL